MDINSLAVHLAQSTNEDLNKSMPPKLKYRLYSWMKKYASSNKKRPDLTVHKTELAKNQMAISVFEKNEVKLEFGAEIPEKLKKAAMDWLKKKKLTPVEASLNKSKNGSTYVILVENSYSGNLSEPEYTAVFTLDT